MKCLCLILFAVTSGTAFGATHAITVSIVNHKIKFTHNLKDGDKGNVRARGNSNDQVTWTCDATCTSFTIYFNAPLQDDEANESYPCQTQQLSSSLVNGSPTITCTVMASSTLEPFKYKITVDYVDGGTKHAKKDPHVIVDNQAGLDDDNERKR